MKNEILKTLKFHLSQLEEWANLDDVADDISRVEKQIAFLENEIMQERSQKQVKELKAFQTHMTDTFCQLMGDSCTNETCTKFYNMEFTITWNEKTITICNSAETYQDIECIIEREIDYLS